MTRDMTKGPIFSTLIKFTIPLILGNLLQLTYNAVDSMIVGRYIGKEALAAVGTSNPLMTLVLLFTNGICLGAGILVSFHYGAHEMETLQKQVSTGMIAGIVFSLIVGALMGLFSGAVMHLMQVDEAIWGLASGYLRMIMLGLVFSFIYNYLASILRAMGDSKSPLYFLGISAVLNILGDLLFVIALGFGVFGAALSTILCEALSAILCWIYIYQRIPELRLGKKWLSFDKKLLKTTVSYGIVSALQQSTVQMGKLAIQAFVNTLGVTTTAAFNATNRIDDYAIVPEQNMAHAMSSIMAQNVGAKQKERVRRAFRYGMYLEVGFGFVVALLLFTFATPVMGLFSKDPEVILEGTKFLRLAAFMYILPGITNGVQGYFRGTGDLKVTLWSSMINMGVRVLSCWILLFKVGMHFEAIPWSYLIGWIAMIGFEVPYLIVRMRKM